MLTSQELKERISQEPIPEKIEFWTHRKLNDILDGVELGELITIAALPGSGKTSLCISLTKDLAERYKCLWLSCEMSARPFLNMFGEDVPTFYLPDEIKSFGNVGATLTWLESTIKEATEKHGVKVVFLDHLQYLTNLSSDKTVQMVDYIMRWLKNLCIKYQIAFFLITHISKDKEAETKRPSLTSMRGSQMIAGESSAVLIIQRLKEKTMDEFGEHPWSNRSRVYVEKNRRTGNLGYVTMEYNDRSFHDLII